MKEEATDYNLNRPKDKTYQKSNVRKRIIENLIMIKKKPKRFREKTARVFLYAILVGIAFMFLFPFMYIIITSIKSNTDLNDFTINWIPRTIFIENYKIAFKSMDFMLYLRNTLIYTIGGTIGHIISCSFIGYGFARFKFPGKKILFILLIVALVVPVQTLIIPLYMTFHRLKLTESFIPVILPTFFGFGLMGPLFTIIFRQFYVSVPKELEDAAKIDGCSSFRTYWEIVLPVVKSAFFVVLVLSVVWHWNDYFEPTMYSFRTEFHPLNSSIAIIIKNMNSTEPEILQLLGLTDDTAINEAVMMAGIMMIVSPLLAFFAFVQKKFVQGIERVGSIG